MFRRERRKGGEVVFIWHSKDPEHFMSKFRDAVLEECPQIRPLYDSMKDPTIEVDFVTNHVRIYEDGQRDA